MPKCFWAVDIVAAQVVALGNPSATFQRGEAFWPIPALAVLNGAKVSTQWAAASPFQPFGVALSAGTEITLGTLSQPLRGLHLYSYRSNASDLPVDDMPEFVGVYPPIVQVL